MIRVLVVDDSALVRRVLSEELSALPDIEVVGTAVDPYAARDEILRLAPDVLTLDVEMPRMDGLSFLAKLMRHHPLPVVVVSSVTPADSANALEALRLGAVEVISKPGSESTVPEVRRRLARAIRAAAAADVGQATRPVPVGPAPIRVPYAARLRTVVVGSSTGGTRALETILTALPPDAPPILVGQHMPRGFTRAFAERLDSLCAIRVAEASGDEKVLPGTCLVAPGDRHMILDRRAAGHYVEVKDGPPVNFHRPSVDALFHSAASVLGDDAVGVILTGMGSDGADGLLAMRRAGAHTIAQDEESCVVFGMPRVAIERGAVADVLPLEAIARRFVDAAARAPVAIG